MATPLFVVLVIVETTDLIFAVDSIPAIFAVTGDPFIVYTSNVFAILGLRSLYFLLAGVVEKFHYLKLGLAIVLMFVGVKMLSEGYLARQFGLSKEAVILVSLGFVAVVLLSSVAASLIWPVSPEEQVEVELALFDVGHGWDGPRSWRRAAAGSGGRASRRAGFARTRPASCETRLGRSKFSVTCVPNNSAVMILQFPAFVGVQSGAGQGRRPRPE